MKLQEYEITDTSFSPFIIFAIIHFDYDIQIYFQNIILFIVHTQSPFIT